MDPDDRLTEELGEELRRSLAEMRLPSEFREELKGRLLATPESRWRRWLGTWPALAQRRGALVGVAAAVIALAVLIPLTAFHHSPTFTDRQYLELVPPGVSGPHAADAAPATCHGGTVRLSVVPSQATLAPGQSATFEVSVTGSSCPLGATVTGPSKARLMITRLATPSSNSSGVLRAEYQVTWTGQSTSPSGSSSKGTGKLAPGSYTVTLSAPPSSARASISVTISQ
ncbi:MAG TPA: hypothetical protein VMW80_08090 [Candidatus Dormibacteraeota bacterium]|nr:hypothetical protein [Candidatus Dormibacteraeota bacterium]